MAENLLPGMIGLFRFDAMEKFDLRGILSGVVEAVRGIIPDVFTTDRPRVSERMEEFAVVSLPTRLYNLTHGYCGMTGTTCSIELFVRDKGGRENVERIDELVDAVCGLFPKRVGSVLYSGPSVLVRGSDGMGFHAVDIDVNVKTI